jgi:hypothetical protein
MNRTRIIYHLARADFVERVRRYSFLLMLGAVIFLGYQAAIGNVKVQVGDYRGEYNSAWVGSMMAVIASFFLGWLGFYLVKGSVARDRETGVGQIMATTPLTRLCYVLGKWFSNFAVLVSMVIILAIVGAIIQIFAGESNQLELSALILPFVFITVPMLAVTSATAVLFETIGFLSGGFGNMLYFFLFIMIFPAFGENLGKTNPAIEPLGFSLLEQSMGAAAHAAFPEYNGGIMLGSTDRPIQGIFHWSGVAWTSEIMLKRLAFFGVAILLILLAALFFDRFDPSRRKLKSKRMKSSVSLTQPEGIAVSPAIPQPEHLTPLTASSNDFAFIRVLVSELRLLLKGQQWWWYAVAAGFIIACLVNPPETVRSSILPIAWLWPVLIWSGMGNREIQHNTYQMVFSSAAPLMRQLPAQLLAGIIIAVVTGSEAALRLLGTGDGAGLLAWFSAALFIPSFALALGVWSNSHKLFEVTYVFIWYLAMQKVYLVDYFGANSDGNIGLFIPLSIMLIASAFLTRARQLQH